MHRDLWTPQGSPCISPRDISPPTPAWPQQGRLPAPHSPALVSWANAWACVPSCPQRGAQCPGWGSPWLGGGRNSPRDYSWWFYNSSVFPTGYMRPHPNDESAERPHRSSWAPSWAPTEKNPTAYSSRSSGLTVITVCKKTQATYKLMNAEGRPCFAPTRASINLQEIWTSAAITKK